MGSIQNDAEVSQCDQRGHKSLSYPILVWDLGKGFEATNVKHSFHLAYQAHIGISFSKI